MTWAQVDHFDGIHALAEGAATLEGAPNFRQVTRGPRTSTRHVGDGLPCVRVCPAHGAGPQVGGLRKEGNILICQESSGEDGAWERGKPSENYFLQHATGAFIELF